MDERRLQEIEATPHTPACDSSFGQRCICGASDRLELIAEVRRLRAENERANQHIQVMADTHLRQQRALLTELDELKARHARCLKSWEEM